MKAKVETYTPKDIVQVAPNEFFVFVNPPRHAPKVYIVERVSSGKLVCDCAYFQHKRRCWHIDSVRIFLEKRKRRSSKALGSNPGGSATLSDTCNFHCVEEQKVASSQRIPPSYNGENQRSKAETRQPSPATCKNGNAVRAETEHLPQMKRSESAQMRTSLPKKPVKTSGNWWLRRQLVVRFFLHQTGMLLYSLNAVFCRLHDSVRFLKVNKECCEL